MNNLKFLIESVAEGMSQFAELTYRHIDAEDVPALLDDVSEYPNFERGNVDKYLKWGEPSLEYVGLFSGKRLAALAVLKTDDGFTVVEQINSFSKGSGARLLKDIIANRGNVVLMANPDADEKLAGWYRNPEFGLKEVTIDKSTYGKPLHFFKTPDCVLSADDFIARFEKKDGNAEGVNEGVDGERGEMSPDEIIRGLLDALYDMGTDVDTVRTACDNPGVGALSRRLLPLLVAAERYTGYSPRESADDEVDEGSGDVVKTYTDLINCNLPRHELVRLLDSLESMRDKPDVVNPTELERLVTMYRRAIAVSDVKSGRTPVRPK